MGLKKNTLIFTSELSNILFCKNLNCKKKNKIALKHDSEVIQEIKK